MKILATYNIKGGVGKTAAAVNLAYLAAREGARTLVVDLDPQGASTFYFRIKAKRKGGKQLIQGKRNIHAFIRGTDYEGLDLLRARFSFRNMDLQLSDFSKPARRLARIIKPLAKDYDLIFLDCPPSISLVSESVFVAADTLLVPTIPTTLSVRTLQQLGKHLHGGGHKKLQVRPFFSMVDRRKSLHRQICEQPGTKSHTFMEAHIPYASVVEQMGIRRAPLATYARSTPAARAFEALWDEIKEG